MKCFLNFYIKNNLTIEQNNICVYNWRLVRRNYVTNSDDPADNGPTGLVRLHSRLLRHNDRFYRDRTRRYQQA